MNTLKVETFANRLFREIFAFREHKLSRAVKNIQVLERFLELVKSFYSEPEVSEILGSILFDEISEVTASAPTVPKIAKKKSKSHARNEDIRTLFSKQNQKPKCTNVIIEE